MYRLVQENASAQQIILAKAVKLKNMNSKTIKNNINRPQGHKT